MPKTTLLYVCVLLFLASCSSTKRVVKADKKSAPVVHKIIANAASYKGTPYRYGGTSRKGMDCSGLIYVAFQKEGRKLPRVSRAMAKKGKGVSLKNIRKGDLLFFKTGNSWRINHVGLVSSVRNGEIFFLHATIKRGVTVSSLSLKYWKRAFVKAKRVL